MWAGCITIELAYSSTDIVVDGCISRDPNASRLPFVPLPKPMITKWGGRAECAMRLVQGKFLSVTQQGISSLMFGQLLAFIEIFCGQMEVTLGVCEIGLCVPDGIDELYHMGGVS